METPSTHSDIPLTPHRRIITRLGGLAATARKLSEVRGERVPKSTVQDWWKSGYIPSRHHDDVLAAGREINPPLQPADFFGIDDNQSNGPSPAAGA